MEVNNKEENKQAFGIQQGSEFSPNIFSRREQQRNQKKEPKNLQRNWYYSISSSQNRGSKFIFSKITSQEKILQT